MNRPSYAGQIGSLTKSWEGISRPLGVLRNTPLILSPQPLTMSVQGQVTDIQRKLERTPPSNHEEAYEMLKTLQDLPMNLDILSSTRIGMTVNKIRKASQDKEVIALAKNLIRKWKKYLPENDGKTSPTPKTDNTSSKRGADSDSDGSSSKKTKVETKKESSKTVSAPPSNKTQSSFPPAASTTADAVRMKCRELLCNAIKGDGDLPDGSNDPEYLAERLEEEIFKEFKNTEMKYKNRIRSRVANLKDAKNPNLRLNFLTGTIGIQRLARMTAEEMASAEMKKMREAFVKEGINDSQLATVQGTKTDMLKCHKCGKRDCTYNQLQTRSADEPMTTFVLCNNCGNRWKFC